MNAGFPSNIPRRAVIFLIDGMRSDGLLASKTPFLDRMLKQGAHKYDVQTVMPSTTLPCHTSLFFSVPPNVHRIFDNNWSLLPKHIPSLFDVIHEHDLPAASFFNWEPLRDLSRPGSLAASFFLKDLPGDDGLCDRELSSLAFSWLRSHDWVFSFLYLHNTDKVGHSSGWMSNAYLAAISNADRCIKHVCRILPKETLIIVTSDHGGHDHTHHTDLPEDMTVPLIVVGPGIPKNHEVQGKVSIMDIAPTILRFLGIEKPGEWRGEGVAL